MADNFVSTFTDSDMQVRVTFLALEKIFETRLKDLRGSVVLVNTWELPPFVVPIEEQGATKYYGPDQQTILVYAEKYNFTIEYVLPSNESAKWGTYTNDSKIFSGQKGLIARGEVHLGAAGNWAYGIPEKYRDIVYPHLYDEVVFMAPPAIRKPYWYAFVLPFHYTLWAAIAFCICVGGLIHWTIAKLCFINTHRWQNIGFSALYNFGAIVGTTMPTDHSPAPTRLFNLSRLLAYFFLTAAFTSSIISYLSVPLIEEPINSIKQVAESRLSLTGIADYYNYFKASVDPYMDKIMQGYNIRDETFDAYEYVNSRLGVSIDSKRILTYYTDVIYKDQLNNPTIHIVKENIAVAQNVAVAPKNSIYTDAFSNISVRLFGTGLHQYWTREATLVAKQKYEKIQPDLYEKKRFDLQSYQAPFLVWSIMLTVAIAVFICERIAFNQGKNP
ncbi:uncharacterized protein LOC136041379 [Artemia franciscana]|uniref:uncharacterized protein LOC136041379 n=1 Tax=Artemia franciscana TaxID=6661 RepID=UPI0032DB0AE1